ncbi:MAG TPA: thrombospondin type 3 repeat-containing protein [Kofleriaceae bacterium]|jgi:hypothetical protein|nr:thrombospondin type 3 repeat-containing protein [Kofleriaceae bacterium]
MRWFLGVLLVAGCGRSHFDDAGQDTGIVGGNGDEDQDGVADGADNCPAIFNQSQLDTDGDAVGDSCDPHPNSAGDHLANASFFAGNFGSWAPDQTANWKSGPSELTTVQDADTTNATLSFAFSAQSPTLQVGFTILEDNNDTVYTNAITATVTSPSLSWSCFLSNTITTAPFSFLQQLHNGGADGNTLVPLPQPLRVGSSTALQASLDVDRFRCDVAGASSPFTPVPNTNATSFSIQIEGVKVALAYALIYDVP